MPGNPYYCTSDWLRRRRAAERQRRHRELARNGLIVLPVVVDEAALGFALLGAGYINVCDQDNRSALAAALSRVVKFLCWLIRRCYLSRVTANDSE
jgi:hypothetical protein